MLNKNKYWRSLLGQRAEILIAKQVAYTAHADYKTFVANAADGEFGFFNASTFALIATGGAVGTGVEIFAAVKRGTGANAVIETSRKFTTGAYPKKTAAYAAAVQQVSKASFTGAPVVGKEYSIKVIETTPGFQQFPSWIYSETAKAGDTLATLMGRIVAKINDKTNLVNKDTDSIVTAAYAAGVVTLTSSVLGASFRIAFPGGAAIDDLAAAADYNGAGTAKPSYGSGTEVQIKELEKYADVLKGVTTNYPGQDQANPEDFGKPDSAVVAGGQYSVYLLAGEKTEGSPTPVEKHFANHVIVLAIPSNGTNPNAAVAQILG